jgi:hypothetical protein
MTQLAADQQLTLQAFQAAVDTYNQRQLALPAAIHAIAPSLEQHLNQLDRLSEIDPTFEMLYQSARSALQTQSSQRAKFLDPSALNSGNITQSRTPANANPPDQNGENGHQTEPATTVSQPIKRFVLATNATEAEKQYFHHYIEQLKQLNPGWSITPDVCNPGEAEAYVVIYQDENYKVNHAAYAAAQIVNQFFTFPHRK